MLENICEILRLFVNTSTDDDTFSGHKKGKLPETSATAII